MSLGRRVAIHCFDVVESTNETILAAGARGEPEGTTHLAREQTRGRGRAERRWWSPRDRGLWMSTLLRPATPEARWAAISLIAGAGVRDALLSLGCAGVGLRWPNDLQVGAKKLGGILCEVRSAGGASWVALGIGINIDLRADERGSPAVPLALRDRIAALAEAGPPRRLDPVGLAAELLAHFWPLYDRFVGGESVQAVVADRLAHGGKPVRVHAAGGPPIDGTIEGLSDEGHLLVRRSGRLADGPPGAGTRLPPGILPTGRRDVVAVLSAEVEYVE